MRSSPMGKHVIFGALAAASALLASVPAAQAEDWTTFMYSNTRTGNNTGETILNAGNIASIQPLWAQDTGTILDHWPVSEDVGLLFGPSTDITAFTAKNTSDGSVVWSDELVPSGNSIGVASPTIAGTMV